LRCDKDAIGWLSHGSTTIATIAAKSIPIAELLSLVDSFVANKHPKEGCALLGSMVKGCTMVKRDTVALCKRFCVVFDSIKDDDRTDDLEALNGYITDKMWSGSPGGSADNIDAVQRLVQIIESGAKLPNAISGRILNVKATATLGVSKVTPYPTTEEYNVGMRLARKSCTKLYLACDNCEYDNMSETRHYRMRSYAFIYSIFCDKWTEPDDFEQARLSTDKLMHGATDYQYEIDHVWMTTVNSLGMDQFIMAAPWFSMLSMLKAALSAVDFWEEQVTKALVSGEEPLLSWYMVIPALRAMAENPRLRRVSQLAQFTWSQIQSAHASHVGMDNWQDCALDARTTRACRSFCWKSDSASFAHPAYSLTCFLVERFLMEPTLVEADEMLDSLQQPEHCPWLKDKLAIYGMYEPVSVLMGAAALALDDEDFAVLHAKAAVGSFKNPINDLHARVLLASCTRTGV